MPLTYIQYIDSFKRTTSQTHGNPAFIPYQNVLDTSKQKNSADLHSFLIIAHYFSFINSENTGFLTLFPIMLMKYLLLLFLFYVNYAFAKSTFHSPDHSKEDDDSKLGNEILTTRKLSPGYVRGRQILTHSGVEGFAFLSIPMAEAPIGQLRFKRPLPRKPWEGVYDATDYKVSCYWNSTITSVFTSAYNMSEDCIHAHVFTNKYCLIKGDCAVAMYIHGGEFAFGSPLQFNPEFLVGLLKIQICSVKYNLG